VFFCTLLKRYILFGFLTCWSFLEYSYQTARKTYNTFATELEVSNTIRDILLGHAPQSINEMHYINRRTIKISEKVQQAHTEILEDFKFDDLANLLYLKMLAFVSDDDFKDAKELIKQEIQKLG
jgi:hypothetical protein